MTSSTAVGSGVIAETLALAMAARMRPAALNEDFMKSWVQPGNATTGLQTYMLQAPSLKLFPVLTPLRNITPRVGGGRSVQANWRAVTAINTGNMAGGMEEGKRGGVVNTSTADYFAKFVTFGLDDNVTDQAQWAAEGFEDIRALAALNLLSATMVIEEQMILGGFGTVQLGTTPTPSVSDVATGGVLLANTQYSVICVAMTPYGYRFNSVAAGLTGQSTRTNGDGTTTTYNCGIAQKSAAGTVTTANDASNTHKIRASVAAVTGAVAYAWYAGASGTERLQAITTINSVELGASALSGTNQLASALTAADYSANTLEFDGFLAQAAKAGSGAYLKALATGTPGTGTPLTPGTDGTISEIDAALQSFWDNRRLTPDTIWMNSQEKLYIRKKVLTGSTAAAQRFTFATAQDGVTGGIDVKSYLNPFGRGGNQNINLEIHPDIPPGTMLFTTRQIPYPMNGIVNMWQMLMRQEYFQVDWPKLRPRQEMGVYADGVMQHFAPFSLGVISNIAAG